MTNKKEPQQLDFNNPQVDFNELELKLVQPFNLDGLGNDRKTTPLIMERARETAKRNGFDYYMFVDRLVDEQHSRPFFLGNIHYYNKKDKLTQIYLLPKNEGDN